MTSSPSTSSPPFQKPVVYISYFRYYCLNLLIRSYPFLNFLYLILWNVESLQLTSFKIREIVKRTMPCSFLTLASFLATGQIKEVKVPTTKRT